MYQSAFIFCIMVSLPCSAADIRSDPLLAKIYAEAQQYENTTFATHIRSNQKGGDESVVHFEPAKGWQLVSINGKPPEEKQIKSLLDGTKGQYPQGYAIMLDYLKDNRWVATSQNTTTATYTLKVDEKSKVMVNDMNMAKFLKTQLTIELGDKPYIKSLTMTSPAAFSPRFGAKVKSLFSSYSFDRRKDGDVVPVQEITKADFKIIVMSNQIDQTQVYSEVGKRVPKPIARAK